MSYEKLSIKQVIEKIGNNEIYLPAIQRKFVWKQEQTEKFFDSIQQGFPIGTFLFWFLKKPHIDSYVFYKFLQNYHQRDNFLNSKAANPELKNEIIGVLDGQQRMSSIYLALQGTYATKKPYASWSNNNAFPKRTLHLNVLSKFHDDNDNDLNFEFKFITPNESQELDKNTLWFEVREVLTWDENSPPIDKFYDRLLKIHSENEKILKQLKKTKNKDRIKLIIRDLHTRLVRDELINYFKITEQDLDKILKIFIRVNSAGTVLSKTDLLFSTIIANWENGREEIENFITTINNLGDRFSFNNDFVMRNCLMLTDCDVLFKVGSFRTENVLKIKKQWPKIKSSILETVQFLVESGINGSTLPSQNSIIPICYYAMKGGTFNTPTKAELKKYLSRALLKNIFSGQGDTVLTNFRTSLRTKSDKSKAFELKNKKFSFTQIAETKLPSNKSLKITDEDIEEFLNYKKGTNAFYILSYLYPNLKFNQVKFHQDHIHPSSQFTETKMKKAEVAEDKFKEYLELRDTLPNLQLLEGTENIKKSKTPFATWIDSKDDSDIPIVADKKGYLARNFIDEKTNLEFKNFLSFHNKRKEALRKKLANLLK
ncbi:DUF262 domain-containing protein [Flavobacteriaceae bacterium TK19130]|nr:DUF262 domain-containing protein [Thermobacterium salinum]